MVAKKYVFFFFLGVILVAISIWQLYDSQSGLTVTYIKTSDPPVTIISPSNIPPASSPTVLIAHGFAGSSVLMRGFALTFAHAGYTTVLWDFQGHGTNPNPLDSPSHSANLQKDVDSAMAVAQTTGLIDTKRIAVLGHSMGSGVALKYGTAHPNTAATIAVSPVSQSVSPDLPHNLLLMAGSLEPQFANNAEELLSLAGGAGGQLSQGSAHNMEIIPGVEHISILFSPSAHAIARSWLDRTFGIQTDGTTYVDRRMLWFGIGIIGFIIIANSSINLISPTSQISDIKKPMWLRMLALIVGGIGATFVLWLISICGVNLYQSLGLVVGGYLVFWFTIAGVICGLIIRPQINLPTLREALLGLIAFCGLWVGVGLIGNMVWIPWLLIPHRLLLWIPCSILLIPWFYSVASGAINARSAGLLGWWGVQSFTILISLILAIQINPVLGFLFLLLPLIPVIIGLHMLVISSKHGRWAYALSGAMFTAWIILAVFPLQ